MSTITDTGYTAIGRIRPEPEIPADVELETLIAAREAEWQGTPRRTRENSKQAMVIQMLQQPNGATLRQLMETTSWQAHTVRGHLSGAIKKKLGLNLVSVKTATGERVYRIT